MSAQPLTSIVIPAFNAEDFLERTLWSAIRQSYKNLEVIIVDDGSEDDTGLIAKKMAAVDDRLRVITVANGGVAKARNVGIEAAKGEFVAFLDADDLWHPAKTEDQVTALTGREADGAAAAYTQMRIIDWEDRVIRNGSGVASSGHLLARHMFARPVGNGSSLLVRRSVALEFGGFDPTWLARGIGGCEDLDLELKIAAKYSIFGIRRYLVGYRSHSGNMSSNGVALARSVLATVEHHIQLHPELPPWAVQKIRASTLEYALQNIAADRRWGLFVAELGRLQRIDLRRGLAYSVRFSARKLIRDLLAIPPISKSERHPMFYDLNPDLDEDLSVRVIRSQDRGILDRLRSIDEALARAEARRSET